MATIDQYLGRGLVFPIQLTPQGLPIISGGTELIRSSIIMILSCPTRQRIFLSSFASRLEELLEEPNDDLLKGLARYFIMASLRDWEQRITVLNVGLFREEVHTLYIEVTYRTKTSGFQDILTFPFYKTRTT